jgi:hypothetical protein
MSRLRFTIQAAAFVVFTLFLSSLAHAQATRTWVSGVGDDVNPCSRTAPCKTFAGAISKTAAGGEINALDPGGYGAVTITKSITIDGGYTMASILSSGTNGVIVNDSATATPNTINVTLRRLSINGAGTTLGLNGIRFLAGNSLNVEDCYLQNFSGMGIDVALTVTGKFLFVKNTNIINAGTAGIKLGTTSGFFSGILRNINIERVPSGVGLRLDTGGFANLVESTITNCLTGVSVQGGNNSGAIVDSRVNSNGTGVNINVGTSIRISDSMFINNSTEFTNNGTIRTHGNNITTLAALPGVVVNDGQK